ncbi:MAG TPA: MDR family MFS transporter [Dehalococcoidia bacterium]|nr:MDR family MFS transporter [Dehalococcoidia bacterium]
MSLSNVPYKWLVATVFLFGLFMDLMDTTIVNVAIPSLSRDFRASTSAVEWTVTGYLLSLAVVIPASGYLADRFGTKRIFLTAVAIFVAGSAACGQAHSLSELVAFRFIQGIGGGMMTPVGTAMLSREFPGTERAKASAIISIPVVLAPTVGPVIGGYLTEYVSWRWIFYVNLPVGIAGFLFGLRVLKEHKEAYAQRGFDLPGLLTGSGGAAMVLYALSQAATRSWTSPDVTGFGLGGLAALAAFTVIEFRVANPLLDLRLFKRSLFAAGNLMMAPAFGAFGGFILILTLFLQELQGYSPLQAGLIQAPGALGTAISLPLASILYPRLGPRRMLMIGFLVAGLTILPFMLLDLNTPVWLTIVFLFVRGLPFAFAAVASQTIIYGPLESAKQGPASSIYNTLRQAAASFGVALIVTITISRTHAHEAAAVAAQHLSAPTPAIASHAAVLGYHEAFLAVALMLGIPFVLAFFINDKDAADTLNRRTAAVVAVE